MQQYLRCYLFGQIDVGIFQRQINVGILVFISIFQIHTDINAVAAGGQVGILDCQVNICTLAHLDDGFIFFGICGHFSRGAVWVLVSLVSTFTPSTTMVAPVTSSLTVMVFVVVVSDVELFSVLLPEGSVVLSVDVVSAVPLSELSVDGGLLPLARCCP